MPLSPALVVEVGHAGLHIAVLLYNIAVYASWVTDRWRACTIRYLVVYSDGDSEELSLPVLRKHIVAGAGKSRLPCMAALNDEFTAGPKAQCMPEYHISAVLRLALLFVCLLVRLSYHDCLLTFIMFQTSALPVALQLRLLVRKQQQPPQVNRTSQQRTRGKLEHRVATTTRVLQQSGRKG